MRQGRHCRAGCPGCCVSDGVDGAGNTIGEHDFNEILQEREKINELLHRNVRDLTDDWGIDVQRFELKDVQLPEAMQQVMAMPAEAIREKRARIIKAEAELEASVKLTEAADKIMRSPAVLELRRMQMVSEVGAENNSATVLMIPSDFVSLVHSVNQHLGRRAGDQPRGEQGPAG